MACCACILVLFLLGFSSSTEFKLSDSKLLLPYHSTKTVNYIISGSGGSCYEWWSGTPEVVSVTPIGEASKTCTNQASVTAVWQSALRRTSTVYARDFATGHVLKCDVIVDDIHSIKVDTTTQELYLHNTPESLVVIGYDEFGNTFSSLDGVPFEWKIHPGSEKDPRTSSEGVLRFLTWTESEYKTPSHIGELEAEGMQGYMQLVSGLRTGSAVVSASLRESVYKNVPSAKVRLLVMANAQLNPPVLYLIPNSVARFQVIVVRQDADEEVEMPSKHYYLQVSDEKIVELDSGAGSTITAQTYGQTTVTLLDRNVEEAIKLLGSSSTGENDTEAQMLAHHRRPMSIVNVVEPAYFRFSVISSGEEARLCVAAFRQSSFSKTLGQSQSSHWTLETGKKYVVNVDLYDQNNHKIFPSDNIRVSVHLPDGVFEVLDSKENGTAYILVPRKTGTVVIKATLEGVLTRSGTLKLLSHPINGNQEMVVHSPLAVHPAQINVAWGSSINSTEGYALHAKGGSGDYIWSVLPTSYLSSDREVGITKGSEVVSVSSDGVLLAKALGSALVVVSDLRNPGMCSHTLVKVNQLSSLSFSPGRVEVYLPKHSLADSKTRLSTQLAARTVALDRQDLLPVSSSEQQPMNQQEKIENTILAVGLKAQDVEGNPITFCHNLPIVVRPRDSSTAQVLPGIYYLPPTLEDSKQGDVCAYVRVIGLREGLTELEVFLASDEKSEENSRAHFPVAVYKDLTFLPSTATVAVAIGSSKRIAYLNGPAPWHLDIGSHFVKLQIAEPPTGKIAPSVRQRPQSFVLHENGSVTGHNFVLRCESVGTFDVHVVVGNLPSSTNPLPAVLSAPFSLICDIPSKIELIPRLDLPTLPSGYPPCPIVNRSFGTSEEILPFSNNAPLNVEVVIRGFSGYELTGVDSVQMRTQITTKVGKADKIVLKTEPEVLGLSHLRNVTESPRAYFTITPRTLGQSMGQLHVQLLAKHEWPGEQASLLESTLSLKMAPKITVEPLDNFQLLFHPKAFANVHLAHGSGYFHFEVLRTVSTKMSSEVCLSFREAPDREGGEDKSNRDFVLYPKCKGRVIIRATDLCFPGELFEEDRRGDRNVGPAFDERVVSVVGLGSLKLFAPSQLELQSKAPAYVRAYDSENSVLSAKFVSLLDLQVVSSSGSHASAVAPCPDSPSGSNGLGLTPMGTAGAQYWFTKPVDHSGDLPGLAKLNLCGQQLGLSKLKIVSGTVNSNVEMINVYAPLSLNPANLNLLLGAAHEIRTAGGPTSCSTTFEIISSKAGPKLTVKQISEGVDSNGIIVRSELGSVGSATVVAKATGSTGYVDLETFDFDAWGLEAPPSTQTSTASCLVNVVAISGVRIGSPLPASEHVSKEGRILIASPYGNASIGGVPIWVEGVADAGGSGVVSPMGLADTQPPLHFSWRLSPPMPSAPAQIFHWLSELGVEPDDTSLSSGMVLVGVAPGKVKLQLTVFTDGADLTGQLTSSGRSVKQLSTEFTFTIVPHLSLLYPPRQNPRVLVTPNSRLQLALPTHVSSDTGVGYSIRCPTGSPSDMLRVSPSGLLESSSHGLCGSWSEWRSDVCRCYLRIDYQSDGSAERSRQSLAIDVVVKPPLYSLLRASNRLGSLPSRPRGLPFGGPYSLSLSFHDELGEAFDAVSEHLLALRIRTHRSMLLGYSVDTSSSRAPPALAKLLLRLTQPLHSDLDEIQATTVLQVSHNVVAGKEESSIAPTYLGVPTGPPLDVSGVSEFVVGQWACLPSLGDGVWSSSDAKLLWIDNDSKFILPLRAGHVHLQFTPTNKGEETRASMLGKLTLKSACARVGSKWSAPDATVMPVGLDVPSEVAIHVPLASFASGTNSSCAASVSQSSLASVSPLTCSARLELPADTAAVSLPTWLRAFLAAERFASNLHVVVGHDLVSPTSTSTVNTFAVATSRDFSTRMVPGTGGEEGVWACIVRSTEELATLSSSVLPPGARLMVQVKAFCGGATTGGAESGEAWEVIRKSELLLAPAFRVLVPSIHLSNSETLVLTPGYPKADLLVFIPPATLAQLGHSAGSESTALKARSQRPDLLAIASAPRPVYSAASVKSALLRLAQVHPASSRVGDLIRNLTTLMENEAQASPDQAFGQGLIWAIGIKSMSTKTAIDAVVDVVLSLKVTGQHVNVPIRVQTRGGDGVDGAGNDVSLVFEGSSTFSRTSQVIILILVTLVILLVSHIFSRKLSAGVGGTDFQKNMPPLAGNGGFISNSPGGTPRLWSQGYGAPPGISRRSFVASTFSTTPPNPAATAARSSLSPQTGGGGDVNYASLFAGQTPVSTRVRQSASPSRLREAFDNSL